MNPPRWEVSGGRDVIAMLGSESSRYDIPNFRAEHILTERCSRVCAWRGVATSYTKFAAESFVDELAAARNIDPARVPHAALPQQSAGPDRARNRCRDGGLVATPGRDGTGPGACRLWLHICRGIAEISVDESSGVIDVHNFWLVADAGYLLQPGNSEAQLEGNVVFGISSALRRADRHPPAGEVQQNNYYDHPVMRMHEMPNIEVRAISTNNPPTGIGEVGLSSTAAGVGQCRVCGNRRACASYSVDTATGARGDTGVVIRSARQRRPFQSE